VAVIIVFWSVPGDERFEGITFAPPHTTPPGFPRTLHRIK